MGGDDNVAGALRHGALQLLRRRHLGRHILIHHRLRCHHRRGPRHSLHTHAPEFRRAPPPAHRLTSVHRRHTGHLCIADKLDRTLLPTGWVHRGMLQSGMAHVYDTRLNVLLDVRRQ